METTNFFGLIGHVFNVHPVVSELMNYEYYGMMVLTIILGLMSYGFLKLGNLNDENNKSGDKVVFFPMCATCGVIGIITLCVFAFNTFERMACPSLVVKHYELKAVKRGYLGDKAWEKLHKWNLENRKLEK